MFNYLTFLELFSDQEECPFLITITLKATMTVWNWLQDVRKKDENPRAEHPDRQTNKQMRKIPNDSSLHNRLTNNWPMSTTGHFALLF